jgi:hypothetical protein
MIRTKTTLGKGIPAMVLLFFAVPACSNAQVGDSIGIKMISAVSGKYGRLSEKLSSKSIKYLRRLQKKEAGLIAKIAGKDSAAAAKLRMESAARYEALENQVAAKDASPAVKLDNYNPLTDSLQTAFQLMQKVPLPPGKQAEITAALGQIKNLRAQINASTDIKKFISERKQALRSNWRK